MTGPAPRFALIALLGLAACDTGLSYYHRNGVAVTRMQSDTTQCQVAALKDAPVANQIRQNPPVFFPGRQICNGAGQCYYQPGYWIPGNTYTVDVNQGLRTQVETQCMARKGYQPVNLPACSPAVRQAAPPRQTTTLPTLTPQSCVIKYEGGGWQVVSPATAPS